MKHFTFLILGMLSFLPISVSGAEPQAPPPADHLLDVSLDIPRSMIRGSLKVPVRAGQERSFQTGRLVIGRVTVNGRETAFTAREGMLTVRPGENGVAEIVYEGTFKGGTPQGDKNYGVVSSTIDDRGISLTGIWYPQPEELERWKLTVLLPAGFEAVSEAETIERTTRDGGALFTFEFPHPAEGLSLVATDRYEVLEERSGSTELRAYFFTEDRELAKTYLRHAKTYFELYEKLLSPYPYKRFSIVENFLPTGYSMATFTLLGQDVVRLPFIVETSLGHEILHQWFGNSVYIDQEKGNWAEGLTTYLADHWYEEKKSKGWEYRKTLLVNYGAYVNSSNEHSLRQFRSRTDLASRSIGYGKAAMVFHMLRTMMGDDAFFGALRDVIAERQFTAASWGDFQAAFEKRSGKDLSPFFRQWIDEKGLPEVGVESASLRRAGNRYEITLGLTRKGSTVALDLPLNILFLQGSEKTMPVTLDADRKEVTLLVDEEPAFVVVDGNYDLARKLTADEAPPVIARLIGEEKPLIAVEASGIGTYQAVIAGLAKPEVRQEGQKGEEQTGKRLTDADLKASTVVILGADNPLIKRLFGALATPSAGFSLEIRKNPLNAEKVVALFNARSAEEAAAAFPKIAHYGKYSSLSFEKGRNTDKKTASSERGIIVELRKEPVVVDLSLLRTLAAVMDTAAAKKIVYVGEYHDRFSHHAVQLRLIQSLHKKNPKLAVGMEMFQRPFQKTLDEYLGGAIDEREFLVRSEYFKRWGFDYNLYKPLLDFARAEGIPVVALNLRREITEKVSREGMDALTDEEWKELPREMDFADEDYRSRIRQAFDQHRNSGEKNFDFFLQAQVLWDETMAESIDAFLAKNPDRQMVVVAGGGHLVYGEGIPKRTFRRNGLPYTVLLNDSELDPAIADYIIFPQPLDGMTAPKLMATFREDKGRLIFNDFVAESPAKAAGLRADDVLIAMDGVPVKTVQDVKLALFYKKKGDPIKIAVVRKRFLLGEKEMAFEVKL